jgi:hypothetical protein
MSDAGLVGRFLFQERQKTHTRFTDALLVSPVGLGTRWILRLSCTRRRVTGDDDRQPARIHVAKSMCRAGRVGAAILAPPRP